MLPMAAALPLASSSMRVLAGESLAPPWAHPCAPFCMAHGHGMAAIAIGRQGLPACKSRLLQLAAILVPSSRPGAATVLAQACTTSLKPRSLPAPPAGAELDPAATCRAAVSFMQLSVGVAVPMLVATWLWQPCEGAAEAGAGAAGMDAGAAAGNAPARDAAPLEALLGGRLGKLGSAAARRAAAADHRLHGWLVGPHRLVAAWFVCGVLWSASKATSGLL